MKIKRRGVIANATTDHKILNDTEINNFTVRFFNNE